MTAKQSFLRRTATGWISIRQGLLIDNDQELCYGRSTINRRHNNDWVHLQSEYESQSVCECELQAFLRAYIVMVFCRIVHWSIDSKDQRKTQCKLNHVGWLALFCFPGAGRPMAVPAFCVSGRKSKRRIRRIRQQEGDWLCKNRCHPGLCEFE